MAVEDLKILKGTIVGISPPNSESPNFGYVRIDGDINTSSCEFTLNPQGPRVRPGDKVDVVALSTSLGGDNIRVGRIYGVRTKTEILYFMPRDLRPVYLGSVNPHEASRIPKATRLLFKLE